MKLLVVELIFLGLCLTSVRPISGTILRGVNVTANAGLYKLPDKYPMRQEDVDASNNGISRMEYLRRFISTGIDRVPILDPYRKDTFESIVFEENNYLSGTINLKNVVATGGKQFSLRNLEIRVQNTRLDFQIYVPQLDIEADVLVRQFIFDNFEIDFSGNLSAKVEGLLVTGALSLIIGVGGDQIIRDDDIVSLNVIEVNSYGETVEIDFTQRGIPRTIPQILIDESIQKVANSVVSTAFEDIENVLQGLTLQQLREFLQIKQD